MNRVLAPTHAEPWAPEIIDLESLNARATDLVARAIDELRSQALSPQRGPAPRAIVAVGPAGVGKTHLFGRLRRRMGARAVFVHVRPLIGAEMTPRFLLGQIVQQLGYDSYGQSQVDIIAGTTLAIARGENPRYPAAMLQQLRELPEEERQRCIEEVIGQLAGRHPDLDLTYLERLLRVPFESRLPRTALLVWLSGRELDEAQARRAGVRDALADGDVLSALRTIAVVASTIAPLVVVFDQLENLVDPEGGNARILAYGNLIAELVDVVRDLVIVQMGLSTEWDQHIEQRLGPSQRSRVAGQRIPLGLPTPDERRKLLELWVRDLPPEAPFPWPFTRQQADELCNTVGLTPRMLLLELRSVLEGNAPAVGAAGSVQPPDDALAAAWEERLAAARAHLAEMAGTGHGAEPAFLLDGFISLAAALPELGPIKTEKAGLLHLQRSPGPAWIALVHQANNGSVRSCFRALGDLPGGVLALRERWREWPPTWKSTREQWDKFRCRPSVRWHWLDREDAARLLALATLLKDARSSDLVGPDGKPLPLLAVESWARARLDARNWQVAQVLLGLAREEQPEPATAAAIPAPTAATAILRRLRIASLERLVRETAKGSPGASRAAVLQELRASREVHFIGDAIACWTEAP